MLDEPNYQYVKGSGWVVLSQETCTKEYTTMCVTRRVTITKRPPEPNERGWFAYPYCSESLEATINDIIQPVDNPMPRIGTPGWSGEYYKSEEGSAQAHRGWVYVVTVQSWVLTEGEWVAE